MNEEELAKMRRLYELISSNEFGNTNVAVVVRDDRGLNVYGYGDLMDDPAQAVAAFALAQQMLGGAMIQSTTDEEDEAGDDGKSTVH